jgi:hypothetical protein
LITLALLLLAADAPQQPQTLETAALKLAIVRAEKAFEAAGRQAAESKIEARRISDEAFAKSAEIEKEAQAKMQAAREAYFKLIQELKGWREGCATDEAQNLKCPPLGAKK